MSYWTHISNEDPRMILVVEENRPLAPIFYRKGRCSWVDVKPNKISRCIDVKGHKGQHRWETNG